MSTTNTVADGRCRRVESGDRAAITADVNEYGGALLPPLLTAAEAARIRALYERNDLFRNTVTMGRHRFGEGQYRYYNTLVGADGRPYRSPAKRRWGGHRRTKIYGR